MADAADGFGASAGDDAIRNEVRPAELVVPREVQRVVVEVAATAIGNKPPNEIPKTLRPIARFTPARRARSGAPLLWAAASGDEDFRASLVEIVTAGMPELVEQVTSGEVPEDADRITVGALRFLIRPDGWEQALTALDVDLRGERSARDADEALERTRRELDHAREQVAQLTRDVAEARLGQDQRAEQLAAETTRLKKEIRALKASLSRAEKAASDFEAERDRARDDVARIEAEALSDARNSAARIGALEAELDNVRRTGRAARDYDEVRLWLLLEQLTQAADGIRGMGLARDPGVRPAEAAAQTLDAGGVRPSVLDALALDRLLHGQHVHLIIDGYNLTKTAYGELSLVDQRARLLTSARTLVQRRGIEATVVFDGQGVTDTASAAGAASRYFRVRFSAQGQLADDLIRELLALEPAGRTVVVASSDKEVAASARTWRAWSVRADTMLDRLNRG